MMALCCATFFRLPRRQVYTRLDTARHGLLVLILVIGGTDTGGCAGSLSKLEPLDGWIREVETNA